MNRVFTSASLAEAMATARENSGKSQQFMAKHIGKSVGTIQNWEYGVSTPTVVEFLLWFDLTGKNPLNALLECVHPYIYADSKEDIHNEIEHITHYLNSVACDAEIVKLHNCMFNNAGSSWNGQLDMLCALNRLPLNNRLIQAEQIVSQYNLAESLGSLNETKCKPDMKNLNGAIENCRQAILAGNKEYSN